MNKPALKRILLIGGIGFAIPLAALAARPMMDGPDACDRPPPMGHGTGPEFSPGPDMAALPPFLNQLDLSEAQRDKIFDLLHAEAPRLRDQDKALRHSHDALRELSHTDNFDAKRAKELSDSGAHAMAEMALARASMEHQIFKLLTPEQRERMQAMGDGPRGHFNRPGRPD